MPKTTDDTSAIKIGERTQQIAGTLVNTTASLRQDALTLLDTLGEPLSSIEQRVTALMRDITIASLHENNRATKSEIDAITSRCRRALHHLALVRTSAIDLASSLQQTAVESETSSVRIAARIKPITTES